MLRFDLAEQGKTIRPLTYRRDSSGHHSWQLKGFAQPHPLYNLHLLTQRPEVPVLLVEGEKSADAAVRLFPEHVVTTCMHGAKSVNKADLTPLIGRDIVIWRDHDEPGHEYARQIIEGLIKLGHLPRPDGSPPFRCNTVFLLPEPPVQRQSSDSRQKHD
ncbi:hypothetical protein HNQ50_001659 [Silvimonas terrae]|uniref:DUF6371 domain-containing protein n=2 Tax=Silvimonas terrae TaxID=300266 RepID=A0A840REW0_9NEIS|nr:hypothetical protein [Silvimonas terrae]